MPTIQDALHAARQRLEPASDSAALDAQVLLGEVLGKDRAYLLAHGEELLSGEELARFSTLVERCASGEPLPYVLGRRAFYDRELLVTPAVLIPRPETELLLEAALAVVREQPQAVAVDVGTGSGALAVTLAALCPTAQVCATDISPEALAVARRNAQQHNANVTFYQGDLLVPLIARGLQADLVMANLPYIPTGDLPALAVSHHEPRLALDGGPDGLDVIRRLLKQIPAVCRAGALILLEIGADQGEAVIRLAGAVLNPRRVDTLKDYAGLDRIIRIQW